MGDERLRELERRFATTGAAEDGAAWLLERVRAGELTRTRLEVAALCGHPGALLATGREPPPDFAHDIKDDTTQRGDPMWWGTTAWGRALWAVDWTAAVRAGWLAASSTLHHWTAMHPEIDGPRRSLDAVAVWLEKPTREHATKAYLLGARAIDAVAVATQYEGMPGGVFAGFAAGSSGLTLAEAADVPAPAEIEPIVDEERARLGPAWALLGLLGEVADAEGTPARVLPRVQRDLLAWALQPPSAASATPPASEAAP